MKRLTLFLGLLGLLPLQAFAIYDIFLENNTPYYLSVNTGTYSAISTKYFGGWTNQKLAPYGRAKVQWFSFNEGIKFGKSYTFFVELSKGKEPSMPEVTFMTTIKGFIYGSSITSTKVLTGVGDKELFNSEPKPSFSKLASYTTSNVLHDNQLATLRADAIKYSVPNKHMNIQPTDAISYVISEKQPQYQTQDDSNQLSMITYNIQVWPIYARAGGIILNKPSQRVLDIAKKVKSYDIATFQEVFDKDHRASLVSAMNESLPYHVGPSFGKRPLGSGVMIFSRWPIIKSKTMVYHHCDGLDCGAAKGASYAQIEKYGKPYHVFSTHFQAGGTDKDINVRNQQIHELKSFIDSQHIPTDEPVIIAGDLNIDGFQCFTDQEEGCGGFKHLLETLNVAYKPHDNSDVLPYTVDGRINWMSSNNSPAILDYVLYMKDHRQPKQYNSRVLILRGDEDSNMYTGTPYGDTDLSDHFSLEARMAF